MTPDPTTAVPNAEQRAQEQFRSDTSDHLMTVLLDDGLYRHLKFSAPGTNIYRFDLVTWPGYLAIVGDIEDQLFARIADMFKFFESSPSINPHYWSEKLQRPDGQQSVCVFSEAAYRNRVLEWLGWRVEEVDSESGALLKAAVHEQLLDEPPIDVRQAVERLYEFEHDGLNIDEPYEWSLTEYSGHFLWCCWAIKWGIEQYRALSQAEATS